MDLYGKSHLPIFKKMYISLATSSLTQLWHLGSFVAAFELLVTAHGIQFPDQGWNPGPLHWELRVLATGPPGKSQPVTFKNPLTRCTPETNTTLESNYTPVEKKKNRNTKKNPS